jgi:hypothetical protein
VPAGCAPAPGSAPGTACGPEGGKCSFPRPPGQHEGYTEPGAPDGNTQNGYEGPQTWFSDVSSGNGSVNGKRVRVFRSSFFRRNRRTATVNLRGLRRARSRSGS